MRFFISILCIWLSFGLYGQDSITDVQFLKKDLDISNKDDEAERSKGLFALYSNHLSEQILNDCIYSPSCSVFSHGAIRHFGFIKGLFLTGDRLMRCNRTSMINIAPVKFRNDNKIEDHWESYTFRR